MSNGSNGSTLQVVSTLLFALSIGGTILTVLLRSPDVSSVNSKTSTSSLAPLRVEVPNAFHLGVTITFPNAEDKLVFLDIFKPIAKYVEDYELGTLSYQLLQSDKDPLRVHVLERYKDKDYFLNVHRNSAEFKYFRGELQKLYDRGAKAEGDSFVETSIGFM